MQAYNALFARVYNQKWQDYANRIAPLIHDFYEATPLGKTEKTLLDVCCGTGQLLSYFLDQGYRVLGLDLSEGMLDVAREKLLPFMVANQLQFIQADAAKFHIQDVFGLAVSTFDALNHLPDMDALQGCFQSVYRVLLPEGYFIFDMNTAAGLNKWNSINVDPGEEIFLVNRGIYETGQGKAWTRITGFVRNLDGLYRRFEQTVYNTVFDMQTVREQLFLHGFRSVYNARGMDLRTPIEDPESYGKVFFIAQK